MVIWRPLIFYTISCLFLLFVSFFFLMIRRPPRSTLFPYTDALPIWRPAPAALLRAGGRWRSRGDLLRRADRRHGRRVATALPAEHPRLFHSWQDDSPDHALPRGGRPAGRADHRHRSRRPRCRRDSEGDQVTSGRETGELHDVIAPDRRGPHGAAGLQPDDRRSSGALLQQRPRGGTPGALSPRT